MLITKEDSGKCAKRILKFLKRHDIGSLDDLERFTESKHYIGDTDCIDISERPLGNILIHPANANNLALTKVITYTRTGIGSLLEVRIDADKQYFIIIIRGDFMLEKYKIFGVDTFGNKAQEKLFHSIYITKIKEELEKLV